MAEITGRISGISRQYNGNRLLLTIEIEDTDQTRNVYDRFASSELLDISIQQHKKDRSREQNSLLWACIHDIAVALQTDNNSVYVELLKRYGKYEYVEIQEEALESLSDEWRTYEVVGETEGEDGEKICQVLCYYGSSQLDSKEFSHLIDGVLSEMREMDLEIPGTETRNGAYGQAV